MDIKKPPFFFYPDTSGLVLFDKKILNTTSYLLKSSPDIIGMQEVLNNQLADLSNFLKEYKYVGVGREDGKTKGEYSPIFYRKSKLKVLMSSTFWLSETPQKISVGWDAALERICTYALFIDRKSKKQFLPI